MNKPFLTYPGGSLTLQDVFQKLPTAMFAAEDTSLPAITFALHSSLRFISQNHFLVERARELGLQNSGEVKYNVGMVLAAYRSYRMANDITDTVKITQSEVDELYAALRSPPQRDLPKGHSPQTLGLIVETLRAAGEDLSCEEVARRAGISRATAQRYLSHLARIGRIELSLRYGSGRPEHRFRWP